MKNNLELLLERSIALGFALVICAGTAVAAVGSAERLELLPAHRDTAVPAVTGLKMQHDANY